MSAELRQIRQAKADQLRAAGIDPYPARTPDRQHVDLAQVGSVFQAAGRVMSKRDMGKAMFADLRDASGSIQLHFAKDRTTPWIVIELLDLGDFLWVKGLVDLTKTGQKTIFVDEVLLLAKSLAAPPNSPEKLGKVAKSRTGVKPKDKR